MPKRAKKPKKSHKKALYGAAIALIVVAVLAFTGLSGSLQTGLLSLNIGQFTQIAGGGINPLGNTEIPAYINQSSDLTTFNGHVFFSDYHESIVRMIPNQSGTFFGVLMKANKVYTIAGKGTPGANRSAAVGSFSGDGGLPLNATLYGPRGLAVAASDANDPDTYTLYIADSANFRIRKVYKNGADWEITTILGGDGPPPTRTDIAYQQDNDLKPASIPPFSGPITPLQPGTKKIFQPVSLTVIGNPENTQSGSEYDGLYFTEVSSSLPEGSVVRVYYKEDSSSASRLYTIAGGGSIYPYDTSTTPPTINTLFRRNETSPNSQDIVDPMVATDLFLNAPQGLAVYVDVDYGPLLFVSDRVTTGVGDTKTGGIFQIHLDDIFTATIRTIAYSGGRTEYSSRAEDRLATDFQFGIKNPTGLTTDTNGNVYYADSLHHRFVLLRRNSITVPPFTGIHETFNSLNYNLITIAGGCTRGLNPQLSSSNPSPTTVCLDEISGFNGTNEEFITYIPNPTNPLTTNPIAFKKGYNNVKFDTPTGVSYSFDTTTNKHYWYIADRDNGRIRRLTLNRTSGNLPDDTYTATPESTATKADGDFTITTIAGSGNETTGSSTLGPSKDDAPAAADTKFYKIEALAFNAANNKVYMADGVLGRIRQIDLSTPQSAVVQNEVGSGEECTNQKSATRPCGTGGTSTQIHLSKPKAVISTPDGIIIGDTGAHRIYFVASNTGEFYGIQIDVGNTYTIAGNGFIDNPIAPPTSTNEQPMQVSGPATNSPVENPNLLTVDNLGNIYFAIMYNHDGSGNPSHIIYKIYKQASGSTPAGTLTCFYGPSISGSQTVPDHVCENNTTQNNNLIPLNNFPGAITFLNTGGEKSLIVADGDGSTSNSTRLVKINITNPTAVTSGLVSYNGNETTFTNVIDALAVDEAGNIYFQEAGTNSVISIIAGPQGFTLPEKIVQNPGFELASPLYNSVTHQAQLVSRSQGTNRQLTQGQTGTIAQFNASPEELQIFATSLLVNAGELYVATPYQVSAIGVPLAPPSPAPVATPLDPNSIELQWGRPTGLSARQVSGYNIFMQDPNGGAPSSVQGNVIPESGFQGGGPNLTGITRVVLTGLNPFTEYTFFVTTISNDLVEGLPGPTTTATTPDVPPNPPNPVTAVPTGTQTATLTWPAVTTSLSGILKYNIYRAEGSATNTFVVQDDPAGIPGQNQFNDSGLSESTTYFYYITSVNNQNTEGAPSVTKQIITPASPTAPPPAPRNLSTALSTQSPTSAIELTWDAIPPNYPGTISHFVVYRNNIALTTASPITTTSFTNTGLSPFTTYTYQVAAVNTLDAEGDKSNQSAKRTQDIPPDAPQNLTAAAQASIINLSWDAVTTSASGISHYEIYRDGTKINTTASPITATSYADTGRTAGIRYTYTVSAVNLQNTEGDQSSPVSVTTLSPNIEVIGGIDQINRVLRVRQGLSVEEKEYFFSRILRVLGEMIEQ
jgi:fibronectin type 3 domain-containing protein